MKQNRNQMMQIGSAIFFALLILLNIWLFRESEYSQTTMFFLIALWVIIANAVDQKAKKDHCKKECRLS